MSDIRVAQPEPYFDPRLPDRAAMDGVAGDDIRTVLRRNGFRVREAAEADGTRYLYGDRHQYTKMATLLTHLGLILFLLAAAVTSRLGDEQGLVVAEGESLTVQPIGTPGLLLVKNLDFEAPGFDTGQPDRLHDRPGRLPGRPPDRPQDDPGERPALDRRLHVPPERLRAGAAPRPQATRPGRAAVGCARPADRRRGRAAVRLHRRSPAGTSGLQLLLDKATDGAGDPHRHPVPRRRHRADGQPIAGPYPAVALERGETRVSEGLDLSIGLTDFGEYTLLIAKRDPGQGLVWIAFACLIAGITITFYLPRRRVWTRLAPDGRLGIVWRSDRYVDVEREFGRLLDQLVAVRRPTGAAPSE